MHIPGKSLNRHLKRESRHRWTRARIVKAQAAAQRAGDTATAIRLSRLIGETETMPRQNQRQRRKAKRQLYASGAPRHVAFA